MREYLNEMIIRSGISPGMWGWIIGLGILGLINYLRGRK